MSATPPARLLAAAAVDLFYRQGATATTVREITQACGLTAGALYNHFSSKEELLYTVVRDMHLALEREVGRAQSAASGPVAELVAIVRVYVDQHARHRKSSRVANQEYTLLTPERRAEIVGIRRRLRDRLTGVLVAGREAGDFDLGGGDQGAATVVATAVLDMCVHVSAWFHEGGALSTAELQDRYVLLALRMAGAARAG
ncbi:TetR/AcrR family transcriptional regulator [Sphaerisporangium corydalis]|uniref:TetR/AcrR family transcriptional regulator n=1 Tax=Sphaerisporangium corydalis TaxID=1441875 RepID=A0ABV9ERJ3_9ACTN|nr:TetR/AcrR family transcriptional regulator [Sphaerisporangium corydalis]